MDKSSAYFNSRKVAHRVTLTHFSEWFLMIRDVSLIDSYTIYVSHCGWTNYS